MNGSIDAGRIALERAGDEHVVRTVERTEPAVVTVERLQAVVHDRHRDLVDGRGARQRERQFAEPAQQTRRPLGLLSRAAFAVEQLGALGFGALPRVDVDRNARRTGDHTVRVAHRFAAALEPVRRSRRSTRCGGRTARRAIAPSLCAPRRGSARDRRGGEVPRTFRIARRRFRSPVRRALRDARPTRRVRCAGPSATCPFRPLPARVRAVARFAPHRSSGPVRPLASLADTGEECGTDAATQHDQRADDVIAFAEDPVDLTERDRQCDREDAECDDIARSRTECGDERAEDQRTDEDGVLRDDVGDDDERDRYDPRCDPPPRPRNGARRARQHHRRLLVRSSSERRANESG